MTRGLSTHILRSFLASDRKRPLRLATSAKAVTIVQEQRRSTTDLALPGQIIRNDTSLSSRIKSFPSLSLDNLARTMPSAENSRGYNSLDKPVTASDNMFLKQKEEWLCNLLETSPQNLSTEAFLIVLRELAQSHLPDAPLRAERWLAKLEKEAEERPSCAPTSECYQRVIEAWAEAKNEDPSLAVTRAERWLFKHIDSPVEALRPDSACFNAFLDACSRGRGAKKRGRSVVWTNAEKAEKTLRYMIKEGVRHGIGSKISPNIESFNYVIRAWTRCRQSFEIVNQAMGTLQMLERYQQIDATVRPNSKSYTLVLDAIAVLARLKAKRCVHQKRDVNDPNENGLSEIELLQRLLSTLQEKTDGGDDTLLKDTSAYNMLISAWANISSLHANAPLEAEKVLQHMITMKDNGHDEATPDALTYSLLMRAWANSTNPNRGKRVAWWLSKQWKDYDFEGRESLCPTAVAYNLAIQTWSILEQPMEAENLLTSLIELGAMGKYKKIAPNSESFTLLIRAWLVLAEKGSIYALKKAYSWLIVLEEYAAKNEQFSVSVDSYSALLAAARQSASKDPGVFDLALDVFDKVRMSHLTTHCLHYSRMLQVALLALSKPEHDKVRERFILQLTNDCCDDGLVSNSYLQALANGPVYPDGWTLEESSRVSQELFQDWPLPVSWSRNVKPDDFLPRRRDLNRTVFQISIHGDNPYRKT